MQFSEARRICSLTARQQVLNQRSALLSNYEVLTLLRELESDHLARTKTALRIKKEEEAAGLPPKHLAPPDDVCENLRTVEVEVSSVQTAAYVEGGRPTDARRDHFVGYPIPVRGLPAHCIAEPRGHRQAHSGSRAVGPHKS